MNLFEDLLISIRRASEVSLSIMQPSQGDELNHGLMILLFMIYNKGHIKTSVISEHFGITSGAATGIADKLEKLGYIERSRSKEDRRIVSLVLSHKGKALVEKKKQEHVALYEYILNDLSTEDITRTIQLLNKISNTLESYQKSQSQ